MKIYILSCDKLIDQTMEMIEYSFGNCWSSANVTVLGYKEPTYKSDFVSFESLGEDKGPNVVCSQLYDYFSNKNDELFVLGVDDQPLVGQVNIELLRIVQNFMRSNKNVGRCGLTFDNLTRQNEKIVDVNENVYIFENIEGVPAKLSAVYSLWNRDYFIKYMSNSTDLWDWEINCSKKSIDDGWKIMGTSPSVLDFVHLYKRGNLKPDWYMSPHSGKMLTKQEQQTIRSIYGF